RRQRQSLRKRLERSRRADNRKAACSGSPELIWDRKIKIERFDPFGRVESPSRRLGPPSIAAGDDEVGGGGVEQLAGEQPPEDARAAEDQDPSRSSHRPISAVQTTNVGINTAVAQNWPV